MRVTIKLAEAANAALKAGAPEVTLLLYGEDEAREAIDSGGFLSAFEKERALAFTMTGTMSMMGLRLRVLPGPSTRPPRPWTNPYDWRVQEDGK